MMPLSSQCLYFHFGMNADDDGFVEYFGIVRMVGANADDMKVLQAKGFIKVFDELVLLITDWHDNNYIQSDRYFPSKYLNVYATDTQVRLGKDRIGKVSKGKSKVSKELDAPQLLKLQQLFPTKSVNLEYEKCKDFIASTGKTYKDYEAMFRNWLRRSPDTRVPPIPPEPKIDSNKLDLINKGKLTMKGGVWTN